MENHVNILQCCRYYRPIPNITLDKFSRRVNPTGFAVAMRLRFEIVQDADAPAFAYQQIDQMRTDQARATRDQCPFLVR